MHNKPFSVTSKHAQGTSNRRKAQKNGRTVKSYSLRFTSLITILRFILLTGSRFAPCTDIEHRNPLQPVHAGGDRGARQVGAADGELYSPEISMSNRKDCANAAARFLSLSPFRLVSRKWHGFPRRAKQAKLPTHHCIRCLPPASTSITGHGWATLSLTLGWEVHDFLGF
jgi:hypothetical protein